MEVSALLTDLEILKCRERQREAKLDEFLDAYVPGSPHSLQDLDGGIEGHTPLTSQSDAASRVLPEQHERVHVGSEHRQSRTEHQGYFGEKLNMVFCAVKTFWYGAGASSTTTTPVSTMSETVGHLQQANCSQGEAPQVAESIMHGDDFEEKPINFVHGLAHSPGTLAVALPSEVKSELKDFKLQDHAFHGQQMGFHST